MTDIGKVSFVITLNRTTQTKTFWKLNRSETFRDVPPVNSNAGSKNVILETAGMYVTPMKGKSFQPHGSTKGS